VSEEKYIMDYVEMERERCAQLCDALHAEPGFLLYCIRAPVMPNEIEMFRSRYLETLPPDEELDDLM
jgi:hypothetical protein